MEVRDYLRLMNIEIPQQNHKFKHRKYIFTVVSSSHFSFAMQIRAVLICDRDE